MVDELIQYGIENYQENYSDSYKDTDFQLYQKYTYEDVCRLLNWQRNMNAQNIGGYFYDATTKTLPVFINYDKAEDAIAYEDRFVTRENLIALSKHPRKVNSSDADHFFKRTESDKENKILLFVRKNKDDKEAKEFYFLGEVSAPVDILTVQMTPEEASIIEFLSKKVTNMKRIYELALLQQLLQQRRRVFTYYEKTLEMTYHKKLNLQTEESVVRNLTNEFPKEEERKK